MNQSEVKKQTDLLESFANEKKLIGFDLHDGSVQLLVGSLLQLESINLNQLDKKSAKKIEESKSLLSDAIEQIRHLIGHLAVSTIERGNLIQEVTTLIHSFQSETLQIGLLIDAELDSVKPLLGGSIYHMVRELLNNIVNHADATRAIASITVRQNVCSLIIVDNGVGIEKKHELENHFGLVGVRSRSKIFGGEFELYSSKVDNSQFLQQQKEIAKRDQRWELLPFESGSLVWIKIPIEAHS